MIIDASISVIIVTKIRWYHCLNSTAATIFIFMLDIFLFVILIAIYRIEVDAAPPFATSI